MKNSSDIVSLFYYTNRKYFYILFYRRKLTNYYITLISKDIKV